MWNGIAKDIGVSFTYQPRDLKGLIQGVHGGSLDAAVAARTVTPEREAEIDFSHPYYSTGLGIATTRESSGLFNTLSVLFSPAFLTAVGTLVAVLLGVGDVDAFIYDAPILRYYLAQNPKLGTKVTVLPDTVERQDYAIALPDGSPLGERINRALLKRVLAPSWKQELDKYMKQE